MRAVGSLPKTVAAARARVGAGQGAASGEARSRSRGSTCPRYLEESGADLQPTLKGGLPAAPDMP